MRTLLAFSVVGILTIVAKTIHFDFLPGIGLFIAQLLCIVADIVDIYKKI